MRYAAALVVLVGCSSSSGDLAALTDRVAALEASRQADADQIAVLKAQLATAGVAIAADRTAEAQRDSALQSTLSAVGAATAALATRIDTITEPHLVDRYKNDVGRWLGGGMVWVEEAGGVFDYGDPANAYNLGFIYEAKDCSGTPYAPANLNRPSPVGMLRITAGGTLWRTTTSAFKLSSWSTGDGSGKCWSSNEASDQFVVRVTDTAVANIDATVFPDAHIELRQSARP